MNGTGLHTYLKNLWHFTREYNQRGNSVPLPSFVIVVFTNPDLTRRIREDNDPAVRVIGRCIGALVVNKLVADIKSRADSITDIELQCITSILSTKPDDVKLLLDHSSAFEFTNIIFFAWSNIDFLASATVPSDAMDAMDVIQ